MSYNKVAKSRTVGHLGLIALCVNILPVGILFIFIFYLNSHLTFLHVNISPVGILFTLSLCFRCSYCSYCFVLFVCFYSYTYK